MRVYYEEPLRYSEGGKIVYQTVLELTRGNKVYYIRHKLSGIRLNREIFNRVTDRVIEEFFYCDVDKLERMSMYSKLDRFIEDGTFVYIREQ